MAEEAGLSNLGMMGDYIPHMQVTIIAANSEWAKANRPIVVRYLKALIRTFRWIYSNKEEAIEATSGVAKVAKEFGARGYDIYSSIKIWPIDGSPTMDGMKVVLDSMREAKMLFSAHRPERYIDLSYLKEALTELAKK